MTSSTQLEAIAWGTPDGQARVRLGDREFSVQQRDASPRLDMAGLCPVEMMPVALAA